MSAEVTFEEARGHVWPNDLACQFTGWMKGAATHSPRIKEEFEKFLAALTPQEAAQLRSAPLTIGGAR